MSMVANASMEAIERFIAENQNVSSYIASLNSTSFSVFQDLIGMCETKIAAYEQMKSQAEALLSKAKSKQAQLSSQASQAASAAASTPKTVTKESTNSKGETVKKEVPNPAHAAAQSAAKAAADRANAAKKVVQNVESFKKNVDAKYQSLFAIKQQLNTLKNATEQTIRTTESLNQSASSSITKTKSALQYYIDVTI